MYTHNQVKDGSAPAPELALEATNNGSVYPTLMISISSFVVQNYEEVDDGWKQKGWQGYANFGALLVMSFFFHQIIMFFARYAIGNDSKLCGGVIAQRQQGRGYEELD